MSHILDDIKEKEFKFVIPVLGKCFKSRISRRDKALVLVLNKGYIEADNIETCYYTTLFLSSHRSNYFVPVGNIDKVQNKSNNIVYRQRIYFKSLLVLFKVLKELNVDIEIPKSFRITTNNLVSVIKDIPMLERYARDFRVDIDTWLTEVCKVLLYSLCEELDMVDKINLTSRVLKVPMGYLSRAPLLCGSYNVISHTSSVIVPKGLSKLLYSTYNSVSDIPFGFTDKNIAYDMERGI